MKNKFLIAVICMFVTACAVRSLVPTARALPAMQQKVPEITLESAQKGFKLYSDKCAGCHHLYEPGKFTVMQWNSILQKMLPKANVRDEQTQRFIREYVHSMSK